MSSIEIYKIISSGSYKDEVEKKKHDATSENDLICR